MAIITIDSFTFDGPFYDSPSSPSYNLIRRTFTIKFNDLNNTFIVEQLAFNVYPNQGGFQVKVNWPMAGSVSQAERVRLNGSFITSTCKGFTKNTFNTSLNYPFVTVTTEANSTDCGFIQPPPPPPPIPPPPPPVCDLNITATATAISGQNEKDGTVSFEFTTSEEGLYSFEILKQGSNEIIQSVVLGTGDNQEFTFQNLGKGLYTIKGNSLEFTCQALTNIEVPDFAFNELYSFTFCENKFEERAIKISIKKVGFSGASTPIVNAGREVAIIKYPDNDDKFKPVLGSECNISLIADEIFQLEDIYTDEERQYLLELSFEETGDLIWSGYILPDQSSEPFKSRPYAVSFKATDGVKVLNDVHFDINEGRITFLEGIKYCLDKTGLQLGFKTVIDFENATAINNALLSGLTVNKFGNVITVDAGTYNVDGVEYSSVAEEFDLGSLSSVRNRITYIYGNSLGVAFTTRSTSIFLTAKEPALPSGSVLIAKIFEVVGNNRIERQPLYIADTLANHTFDVKRFILEDGEYTDCYTVLEYLVKQFTAQLKQADGFWVIENVGYKARGDLKEFAYNNDLSVIYSNQDLDLLVDISCSQSENTLIEGSTLTIGAGYKKSIVLHRLGYPAPVFKNFGFEQWVGNKPTDWQIGVNGGFGKGSKFDRFYDPTTGEVTTVENGEYYLSMRSMLRSPIQGDLEIKSSQIPVFNQEVIDFSFQFIGNPDGFLFIDFYFQVGNLYYSNFKADFSGKRNEGEIWTTEKSPFVIELTGNDFDKFPALGNETNVNFSFKPCPIQGFFTFIIISKGTTARPNRNSRQTIGFDNFKIRKTSPITGAKILEEDRIEVLNGKKFSTIPDEYEVFFGDVDNVFRTDGIKTISGTPTLVWRRKGLIEAEGINTIVAREILSQYQSTYRILEGDVLAPNLSIRSIYNLPTFDLFRFCTLSASFNLIECSASINIAEIYAEEGVNSGPIGGGTGLPPGGQVNNNGLILGFKNNIIATENNIILIDDGI